MSDNTPGYGKASFVCPRCHVLAQQFWSQGVFYTETGEQSHFPNYENWDDLQRSTCGACGKYSIWRSHTVVIQERATGGRRPFEQNALPTEWLKIWPKGSSATPPHKDLPPDLVELYEEARAVFDDSPRSSAALLRLLTELLLQKLTKEDTINNMIGALVKGGLDTRVQRAADILRVGGNEAVHPGSESDDEGDTAKRVGMMFDLVNRLVQDVITSPQELNNLYEALPVGKREAIEKRDGGSA